MGGRKITVKQSSAHNIAAISWFIESKGMTVTAEKFSDDVYDYFVRLSDTIKSYPICREQNRAAAGYKCLSYKKKIQLFLLKLKRKLSSASLSLQNSFIGSSIKFSVMDFLPKSYQTITTSSAVSTSFLNSWLYHLPDNLTVLFCVAKLM